MYSTVSLLNLCIDNSQTFTIRAVVINEIIVYNATSVLYVLYRNPYFL